MGLALTVKKWQNRCIICQNTPQHCHFLCQNCHNDLPKSDDFLLSCDKGEFGAMSAFAYVGVIKRAMIAFKNDNDRIAYALLMHAVGCLADVVNDKVDKGELSADTVIVPVPTTATRLGEKGFYGVGMLTKSLSQMTGLAVADSVVRVADGVRQRQLGRTARLDNVKNAFALTAPIGDSVIIFDDVITTGATVAAIANAILADNERTSLLAMCLAHGNG